MKKLLFLLLCLCLSTPAQAWFTNVKPSASSLLGGGTLSGDLFIYDPTNDGNPKFCVGATAAESACFQSVYDAGAQTLDYLLIETFTADAGADAGRVVFSVDESTEMTLADSALTLSGSLISGANIRMPIDSFFSLNGSAFPLLKAENNGAETDVAQLFLGSTDNVFLISNSDSYNDDHGIDTQTNPTLCGFSDTDVGTPTTDEWWCMTHDVTDMLVTTGSGDIRLDPAGGNVVTDDAFALEGGNGSSIGIKTITELVTIPVGEGQAPTVSSSTNLLPANSLILGMAARVTDAPGGGATLLTITDPSFNTYINQVNCVGVGSHNTAADSFLQSPVYSGSAQTATLTTDANVTVDQMQVRIITYYIEFTEPTS